MSLPQETMIDLMAYADGELEGDARTKVEELVRTNDEARRVLEAMGALGDVVREGAAARAEAASVNEIADEVIAKIERGEPTLKGKQIVVPIGSARGGRGGIAAAVAVLALAAAAFLVLRTGAQSVVADNTSHETPPVVQPDTPSPSATEVPSAAPAAMAQADEQGVDLEEVSSTKGKVNVFFMPSPATAGAVASVVVWIDDRHGAK